MEKIYFLFLKKFRGKYFIYLSLIAITKSDTALAFTLTNLYKYDEALEYLDRAFRHKRVFGWNFIFSEINDLIDQFPVEMKNIIRIKYQYKFNK